MREPEAVAIPIEGELDLHAFAPRDVASVVTEYVSECARLGIRSIRFVHGRGKGVQRAIVARTLHGLEHVAAFEEAAPSAGGWGATIVFLRPGPSKRPSVDDR